MNGVFYEIVGVGEEGDYVTPYYTAAVNEVLSTAHDVFELNEGVESIQVFITQGPKSESNARRLFGLMDREERIMHTVANAGEVHH